MATPSSPPTEAAVRDALRAVVDPELDRSMVDLGMVRAIFLAPGGQVQVVVRLSTPGCAPRAFYQREVARAVGLLPGVTAAKVDFDERPDPAAPPQPKGANGGLEAGALASVKNVICVGSGKGGVGKSTTTANLAAALFAEGKRAAALDADVWGYSIPRMLGVHGKPAVSPGRKIMPLVAHGGIGAMSIEFFLEEQDQAIVWRGPMLHKAIRQFLEDVDWGELDYLLIDLPPGTGDVSMTLAQLLPDARFLVVTTPQPAAQKVAARAADTARKFDLELLGVIENMSGFVTPGGERLTIFGEGGGQLLADQLDVPLLAKVPLQEELRVGADAGVPLVLSDPDAPASQALFHAARGIIAASPTAKPAAPAPTGLPLAPAATPARPAAAPVTGHALPLAPRD